MDDISWPADNQPSTRWPIYTRGNVGEVYPDVVLPLEWDLGGLPSEAGWRAGAEAVGFVTADDYGPGEFVVMGVFGGYAYFNASLMRLLGVRTPGLDVGVIDSQFLGDADVPAYQRTDGDRNLMATAKVVRTAIKTLTAKKVPLVDEMRIKADAHRAAAPPLDAPDEVLWSYIKDGLGGLWEFLIGSHVINTMQATIASGNLTDLCEKHLGDPNLALALTTGIGDVVSAHPAKEMWQLANETPADQYDAAFSRFLDSYGHRGPNEFSLLGRDWAAFPEIATAAINTMRGVDPDRSPVTQGRRMAEEREAAVSRAKATLGWRSRLLERAINSTALWSRAREESKDQVIRANQPARHAFLELLRRARDNGGAEDTVGPMLLVEEEFLAYLQDPPSMTQVIEARRQEHEVLRGLEPPFAFDVTNGGVPPTSTWTGRQNAARPGIAGQGVGGKGVAGQVALGQMNGGANAGGQVLEGAAGAPGVARGKARVILDPADPTALNPGDVLVAPRTDPAWTPLFVSAAAVIVEVGAAMSHSMIVSRELGIPCVVGIADATLSIPDGAEVEVDGGSGLVTLL